MRIVYRLLGSAMALSLVGGGLVGLPGAARVAHAATAGPVVTAAKKVTPKVTLTLSKRSVVKGASVKAKAAVKYGTKKPAGKVAFYDGKKKLKTVTLKKGAASYPLPKSLKLGKHSIKAKYAPSKAAAKRYKARWSATKALTVKPVPHSATLSVYTLPSTLRVGQSYTVTMFLKDADAKSTYPRPTGKATVSIDGVVVEKDVPVAYGFASIERPAASFSRNYDVEVAFTPSDGYYKKQTLTDWYHVYPKLWFRY